MVVSDEREVRVNRWQPNTGARDTLATMPSGEVMDQLHWSPDGAALAYRRSQRGEHSAWVVRPGDEPRQVAAEVDGVLHLGASRLLFRRAGELHTVSLDQPGESTVLMALDGEAVVRPPWVVSVDEDSVLTATHLPTKATRSWTLPEAEVADLALVLEAVPRLAYTADDEASGWRRAYVRPVAELLVEPESPAPE